MAYDGSPRLQASPLPSTAPSQPISDDEPALARAYQAGNQGAGHRLVAANMATVVRIAHKYRRWGVPLEDLIQQGSIGLLKASRRFDPSRDNSLSTYASYWIRAEIRDYVVRGYRIVRLGSTRTERRAMRTFRTKRIQSVEQLVELSGMPEARCRLLWPLLSCGDRSLDVPGRTAQPAMLCSEDTPESLAIASEERGQREVDIQTAISELSEREQVIVRARLMQDDPPTLESLGKQMGVSRERIRQLEKKARERLASTLADHVA